MADTLPIEEGNWLVYIHTCLDIMFVMDRVTPLEGDGDFPPRLSTALRSLSEPLLYALKSISGREESAGL
jgi:hypothetical protein